MRVVRIILSVLMMSSLGACAFGDRNVILDYPPATGDVSSMAVMAADKPVAGDDRRKLVISLFDDLRGDKVVIGEVTNGYGFKTADVNTQSDVRAWIREAARHEFQAAGFDVSFGENSEADAAVLKGQIITVYGRAYVAYQGEVTLNVTLEHDGLKLMENHYNGKGSRGLNVASTSSGHGESITLALEDALVNLVIDVRQVLNKNSTGQSTPSTQPVSKYDVTGTYISEITTDTHWVFERKKHRNLQVILIQNGNSIKGVNSSANLRISGTLEDNNISFFTWPSDITSTEIKGNWQINANGTGLKGKWTHPHGSGKWDLKKIK